MFRGKIRWWMVAAAAVLLLLGAGFIFLSYRAHLLESVLRKQVERELSDRFESAVELKTLQVRIFPRIGVAGGGLTMRHHGRTDIPPLIQIEHFAFSTGLTGLMRPTKHVSLVHVDRMVITLPPRNEHKEPPDTEKKKPSRIDLTNTILDEVLCHEAELFTTPTQPGKEPLDWQIHDLVLDNLSFDKPFAFRGTLTNAKPVGEISTHGQFGPWNADEPGDSPVGGEYEFKDADLGPFPGIAGTLSSTGQFYGQLNELQAKGVTDMANFSLDRVGKPVTLHTEFEATVDGTNGDTYLHPVRATLGKSPIFAEGKIVLVPKQGHFIVLDVSSPRGRIEDMLNLALNSERPLMTGPVKIKANLKMTPGKETLLNKLVLDGTFGVEDAKWSSPEVREKLEGLSRKAQGKPQDEDAGSALADLRGTFHLEKGVIKFHQLNFGIEGALIDLAGTYDLVGGNLDLQ